MAGTEMQETYRIVEERDGKLYPLMHKKSSPFAIGKLMEADVKLVRDGSGDRWYWGGFHSIPSVEDCRAYRAKFREARRRALRIVKCSVSDTWPKEHSPAPIVLSRYMRIEGVVE